MSKVIYGQYDSKDYPLKKFYLTELPKKISDVLYKINQMQLAVFRGGLAFVFLMDEERYILKDLDMLALNSEKENIIDVLKTANIVYVNKNTFGDSVITAFWEDNKEYFKLDVLLCNKLPNVCKKMINGRMVNMVSISYIWKNRIEKIAEKEIRRHNDKKTLNHYITAKKLSKYLLQHKEEIFADDMKIVESKLNVLEEILSNLISKDELNEFLKIQTELIRG